MTAIAPASPAGAPTRAHARIVGRKGIRHAGWPLTALLMGYPVWWALGMGTLILFVLPVPMIVHLVRRGRVAVPPGFLLWLGFLLCVLSSTAMLGLNPPGTVAAAASHRLITVSYNLAGYLAATVILLYAGNLTEQEFPRRRLVRQLAFFFCVVVAGGLLGLVAPSFQFTSPVERLLPASFTSVGFVQSIVHPTASQLQAVLGFVAPRPSAPFGYTNTWGNCIGLLIGWFIVAWLGRGSGPLRRLIGVVILGLSALPIVWSLNRGLWVALGLAVLFVIFRQTARGNVAALAGVVVLVVTAGVLVLATPLTTVVQERFANQHSNDVREFTTVQTLKTVEDSPLLGLGAVRIAQGSASSIAVGRTPACPRCGNAPLGANGQLWAVIMAHGYLGAFFYAGFFLWSMWVYRRDRTPIGEAGLVMVLQSVWFLFVYNALCVPLVITFLGMALLWRNRDAALAAASATAEAPLAATEGSGGGTSGRAVVAEQGG